METACNLIIDSCCDLPYELVDKEGIYLVKFPYTDSNGEHLDDLYRSRSAADFFNGMRKGEEPYTAQLSMQSIREAFEWAYAQGKPAVFLCFSSGLSGTFDTITIIHEQMKKEKPDLDITVVDTKLASTAEALLVYEAIRQWERGMSAAELAAWAEEARYYVQTSFMVDDLNTLRRGGRIPATVAFAGAKLDVKPLLSIDLDGKLTLTGMARGRKKGLKSMLEFYKKNRDEQGQAVVAMGNADCEKDAKKFAEMIKAYDDNVLVLDTYIGPVIGSHVGPDMVSLVFWGSDRRKDISVSDRIASQVKGK